MKSFRFVVAPLLLAAMTPPVQAQLPDKAASSPVTYIPADQVTQAFVKGAPLLEVPQYKVHASRRDKPGLVEMHEHETDVVYVLEGTATLVTGGEMVDPKTVSPGEIRATSVNGGETRQLSKGDVVIVPEGTPHWFKEVSGPFLYFVVKPISPATSPGGGRQ